MSIISTLPLTKLKREAQYRQRPLKHKQQETQKRELLQKTQMATKIQITWRNYLIKKQKIQEQIIQRLLMDINKISLETNTIETENRALNQEVVSLQNNYNHLVEREKQKQIQRVVCIYKKTFNSILSHQIQHSFVQQQLRQSKQNNKECQKVLQELIQCTLALQKQQQEMVKKEKEYQGKIKQLEEKIIKETLSLNQLEFEYQQMNCKKRKIQLETTFKEYLS